MTEPRFHLDLDRNECFSSSVSTKRVSPFVLETRSEGSVIDERREEEGEETERGVRLRPRGETSSEEHSRSPRRGLNTYLSRFDDAIKLRGQLTNEKASQESGADADEFDSFRLFRLLGSVVLAVCVRIFVCHYLVREKHIYTIFFFLQLTDYLISCIIDYFISCIICVLSFFFSFFNSPYLHPFSPWSSPTWAYTNTSQR